MKNLLGVNLLSWWMLSCKVSHHVYGGEHVLQEAKAVSQIKFLNNFQFCLFIFILILALINYFFNF